MTVLYRNFDKLKNRGDFKYNNVSMPRVRKRRRSNKGFTWLDVELKKRGEYNYNNSKTTKGLVMSDEAFFTEYLLEAEANSEMPKLTKEQFFIFIIAYFKGLVAKIVNEGYIFSMPFGLGRMFCKKGNKSGAIRFSENGKVVKAINPVNFETFRKYYFIRWSKEQAHIKNKSLWNFSRSIYFREELKKKIYKHRDFGEQIIAHDHNESKYT